MIDKFTDTLDGIKAGFEAAKTIEVIASGLIDTIPVLGAFVDSLMDYLTEIQEFDIVNLQACVTEEFEDVVFCALYCELGTDGLITDEIYSAWAGHVALFLPCAPFVTLVGQCMALMMAAIGANNARVRGFLFKTQAECRTTCDDCPPDQTIDITMNVGTVDHSHRVTGDRFTVSSGTLEGDPDCGNEPYVEFSISPAAHLKVISVTGRTTSCAYGGSGTEWGIWSSYPTGRWYTSDSDPSGNLASSADLIAVWGGTAFSVTFEVL
jgi:hypothetical protein